MQSIDPDIRTLNLPPRHPMQDQQARSVGYFGGDIPSIIVHVNGRKSRLYVGQCIPTNGYRISIENPYERTAKVNVMYNAPPALQPVAKGDGRDEQSQFVTYYGTFKSAIDPAKWFGAGFLIKEGRALVDLEAESGINVYVLPDANIDFLNTKPATYMPETLDFKHPTGDVLDKLVCIHGEAPAADVGAWIAAAGYDASKKHYLIEDRNKTTVMLEAGTALFAVSSLGEKFKVNVTARDFGADNGPSYV